MGIPREENPSLTAAIETIKQLDGVDTRAKIELIFILLGEKPSTEFFVRADDIVQQKAISIRDTLLEIGLECELSNTHREDLVQLKVTGNVDDMNEYSTAEGHRKRGIIYGFPASAVDAYTRAMNGEPVRLLAIEDLPEDIQSADYAPFCQFCFSERWEEELAVPKRWSELAKRYAPELHEDFLREWRATQKRHMFQLQELEESLPEDLSSTPPTLYTLVNIENRWAQALPESKVRWLDNGKEESIAWQEYELIKKWKPEMETVHWLAQKMHNFTPYELSNVQADQGDEQKMHVKLFGEYIKKKSTAAFLDAPPPV